MTEIIKGNSGKTCILPRTVTKVRKSAFSGAATLQSVIFNEGLERL